MLGVTRRQLAHAAMAVGAGFGVFLAEASSITTNPWVDAGCYAGLAVLTGLGVGVAKRTP